MDKSFTKLWKDGKLQAGEYYVKDSTGVETDGYYPENSWERGFVNHSKHEVKEVLAPVPSYDEWTKHRKVLTKVQIENCDLKIINEKLKEQLEIATKVLQYYADGTLGSSVARQALKEMEGVK